MPLLTLLTACAEAPSLGDCATRSTPSVTLANRYGDGAQWLSDGDTIEIFLPPQGGVFTELDVGIAGLADADLATLTVTIDAADDQRSLAVIEYDRQAIVMWCSDQQFLQVDDLPVGFSGTPALRDLHDTTVVLTGVVQTPAGEFSTQYDVALEWVEY